MNRMDGMPEAEILEVMFFHPVHPVHPVHSSCLLLRRG
jgi:hypothetical protein